MCSKVNQECCTQEMGTNRLVVSWCILSVILTWTLPTGQACTPEGLLTVEALSSTQQSDRHSAEINQQWIFPSIKFTCMANVTGWVFTVGASGRPVVCPIVELWEDMPFTPISTDYTRLQQLSTYSEPVALSDSVYECTLHTPVIVNTGTVLGFQTTSTSAVQLMNSETAPDGYSRSIGQIAVIFNTAQATNTLSGSIPLITPVASIIEGNTPQPATTHLPTSSSTLPTLPLTQPHSPLTLSTPSSPSHPTSETPPLPISTSDPSSEESTGEESSSISPVIVAIVVVIVILVVIAVAVLFLVLILVARHRRQISPQPSKTVVENGSTIPGPKKPEISRVRSRNNYTSYNTGHIYEDVGGLSLKRKQDDHDYDYINSVSVGPNDDPKNYEIPQSSPSKASSNGDSLVYEVPGDILDESCPDTYDIPVATQGPVRRSVTVVESGYDTPLDTQTQVRGKSEAEEDIYETPGDDEWEGDRDTDSVYEDVGPAT